MGYVALEQGRHDDRGGLTAAPDFFKFLGTDRVVQLDFFGIRQAFGFFCKTPICALQHALTHPLGDYFGHDTADSTTQGG